jgi:hypothetical protein
LKKRVVFTQFVFESKNGSPQKLCFCEITSKVLKQRGDADRDYENDS